MAPRRLLGRHRFFSFARRRQILEDRKSKLTLKNTDPYDDLMSGRTSQLTVDDVDALERVLSFLADLPAIKDRNEAIKALLRVLDPTALAMYEASEPASPAPKRPPLRLIKRDNDADQDSGLSHTQNGRDQRIVSRRLSKTGATNATGAVVQGAEQERC